MTTATTFSRTLEDDIAAILECNNDPSWEGEPRTRDDAIVMLIQDIDDRSFTRLEKTELRRHGIAAGFFREISDDEIARTVVTSGRAWDFKLDGKKYVFDHW